MKKILFSLIIIFNVFSLYSQGTIKAEIVHKFIVGDAVDEIGVMPKPEGEFFGILAFSGSYNQYIFRDDPKGRFLYFDLDFNYKSTIKSEISKYWYIPYIDYEGNFYMKANYDNSITKFTKDFIDIYKIQNDQFKSKYKLYFFDNHLIIDDLIYDPSGKLLEGEKRKEKVESWFEQSDYAKVPELRKELLPLVLNNSMIICGNRFYSDPYTFSNGENINNYFKILCNYYNNMELLNYLKNTKYDIVGYDIHNNNYIHSTYNWDMFIVNKFMKTIKYFNISMGNINAGNLRVAPNGDLIQQNETTIYRVKNTWDPISNEEVDAWIEKQKKSFYEIDVEEKPSDSKEPLFIKTLTTTSTLTEPNDKNAYHPVKAFDNNPKTMWIEAAKGPGLGEYLEVELSSPVTFDSIQIQPGCFWEEYWKQNNRIRQMTIYFDDEKYILNFQDVMKNQGTSFKQPITFSKARFVINDVYKTTNWDDTAISDIWFMKDGEPIELGLGEYAGVLK